MQWKDIVWKGCNPANYDEGRGGKTIRYITFHHAVGSMESVNSGWQNPARGASSHFTVGERGAWQFVDTDDTAWCNGNYASNQECISIEHEGDWRFGYTNAGCIEKSAQLIALLRKTHPTIVGWNKHNQVSLQGTACPCDLPCEQIWNRSTQLLNPPVPVPPVASPTTPDVNLQVIDIQNRKVVTNKDTNLWDLHFTTWAGAKSIKVLPKGTEIEVSATAKHPLGGIYYLSEYSFSKGIMNGINSVDVDEISVKPVDPVVVVPPVVVTPEPPKPVEPPITDTPPIVPVPEKPVVTPPAVDYGQENNNLLKQILALVTDILNKIKSVFK